MRARVWMVSAFVATLVLAAAILLTAGIQERGVDLALQATGRLLFLLFWPAYSGVAGATLLGPSFGILKRHAREFGLAFAAALVVHIGLVIWLCHIGHTPPFDVFLIFGVALFWTCILTLLSIERLRRLFGPRAWGLIRGLGLNYVAFAFASDFLRAPAGLNIRYVVAYLPFNVLLVIGVVLRLVAWLRRRSDPGSTVIGAQHRQSTSTVSAGPAK